MFFEVDGISSTMRGSADNTFRDPQSMPDLAVIGGGVNAQSDVESLSGIRQGRM